MEAPSPKAALDHLVDALVGSHVFPRGARHNVVAAAIVGEHSIAEPHQHGAIWRGTPV
jgi:hypothetical protein